MIVTIRKIVPNVKKAANKPLDISGRTISHAPVFDLNPPNRNVSSSRKAKE